MANNRQAGKRGMRICNLCGIEYEYIPRMTGRMFCSVECYRQARRKIVEKICPWCGKSFTGRNNSSTKIRVCCSPECANLHRRKSITVECSNCGEKFSKPPSVIKGTLRPCCSLECNRELRRKVYLAENNPNWKGGVKPETKTIRDSQEGKEWRAAVFERDGYTCRCCNRVGHELTAHHIKPFSKYPWLRFEVFNGITLCDDCHKEVHACRTRPIKTGSAGSVLKRLLRKALEEPELGFSEKRTSQQVMACGQ